MDMDETNSMMLSPNDTTATMGSFGEIPFNLHMTGKDGTLSMVEKTNTGRQSPVRAKTMKDYDQEISALKKENFDLKLRIYFLEERVHKESPGEDLKMNIELKVQNESLKKDLMDKEDLLQQVTATFDAQLAMEIEKAREDGYEKAMVTQGLARSDLNHTREELSRLSADLASRDAATSDLSAALADKEAEIGQLTHSLHEAMADAAAQQNVVGSHEAARRQYEAATQRQIDGLQREAGAVQPLKEELEDVKSKLIRVEKEREAERRARDREAVQEREHNAKAKEREEKETEWEMERRLAAAEEDMRDRLAAAQKEADRKLGGEKARWQQEMSGKERDVVGPLRRDLEKAVLDAETSETKHKRVVEEYEVRLDTMKQNEIAYSKTIQGLVNTVNDSNKKHEELQDQLSLKDRQIGLLREEIGRRNQRIKDLENELDDLHQQLLTASHDGKQTVSEKDRALLQLRKELQHQANLLSQQTEETAREADRAVGAKECADRIASEKDVLLKELRERLGAESGGRVVDRERMAEAEAAVRRLTGELSDERGRAERELGCAQQEVSEREAALQRMKERLVHAGEAACKEKEAMEVHYQALAEESKSRMAAKDNLLSTLQSKLKESHQQYQDLLGRHSAAAAATSPRQSSEQAAIITDLREKMHQKEAKTEVDMERLYNQVEEAESKNRAARLKAKQQDRDLETIRGLLEAAENTAERLRRELADKEKDIQDLTNALQRARAALEAQAYEANSVITVSDTQSDIMARLREAISELLDNGGELPEPYVDRIHQLESQIDSLKNDHHFLVKRLSTTTGVNSLDSSLDGLSAELLKAKLNHLATLGRVRLLEQQLLGASHESADSDESAEDRLVTLQGALTKAQAQNEALRSQLQEQQGPVSVATDLDKAKRDNSLLKRQLELNSQSGEHPQGFNPSLIMDLADEIEQLREEVNRLRGGEKTSGRESRPSSARQTTPRGKSAIPVRSSSSKRRPSLARSASADSFTGSRRASAPALGGGSSGLLKAWSQSNITGANGSGSLTDLQAELAETRAKLLSTEVRVHKQTDKMKHYRGMLEEAGLLTTTSSRTPSRCQSETNLTSISHAGSPSGKGMGRGFSQDHLDSSPARSALHGALNPARFEDYGKSGDPGVLKHQVHDMKSELGRYRRIIRSLQQRLRSQSGNNGGSVDSLLEDVLTADSSFSGKERRDKAGSQTDSLPPSKLRQPTGRLGKASSVSSSKPRTSPKGEPSAEEMAALNQALQENEGLRQKLEELIKEFDVHGRPSELKKALDELHNHLEQKATECSTALQHCHTLEHRVNGLSADNREKDVYIHDLQAEIANLKDQLEKSTTANGGVLSSFNKPSLMSARDRFDSAFTERSRLTGDLNEEDEQEAERVNAALQRTLRQGDRKGDSMVSGASLPSSSGISSKQNFTTISVFRDEASGVGLGVDEWRNRETASGKGVWDRLDPTTPSDVDGTLHLMPTMKDEEGAESVTTAADSNTTTSGSKQSSIINVGERGFSGVSGGARSTVSTATGGLRAGGSSIGVGDGNVLVNGLGNSTVERGNNSSIPGDFASSGTLQSSQLGGLVPQMTSSRTGSKRDGSHKTGDDLGFMAGSGQVDDGRLTDEAEGSHLVGSSVGGRKSTGLEGAARRLSFETTHQTIPYSNDQQSTSSHRVGNREDSMTGVDMNNRQGDDRIAEDNSTVLSSGLSPRGLHFSSSHLKSRAKSPLSQSDYRGSSNTGGSRRLTRRDGPKDIAGGESRIPLPESVLGLNSARQHSDILGDDGRLSPADTQALGDRQLSTSRSRSAAAGTSPDAHESSTGVRSQSASPTRSPLSAQQHHHFTGIPVPIASKSPRSGSRPRSARGPRAGTPGNAATSLAERSAGVKSVSMDNLSGSPGEGLRARTSFLGSSGGLSPGLSRRSHSQLSLGPASGVSSPGRRSRAALTGEIASILSTLEGSLHGKDSQLAAKEGELRKLRALASFPSTPTKTSPPREDPAAYAVLKASLEKKERAVRRLETELEDARERKQEESPALGQERARLLSRLSEKEEEVESLKSELVSNKEAEQTRGGGLQAQIDSLKTQLGSVHDDNRMLEDFIKQENLQLPAGLKFASVRQALGGLGEPHPSNGKPPSGIDRKDPAGGRGGSRSDKMRASSLSPPMYEGDSAGTAAMMQNGPMTSTGRKGLMNGVGPGPSPIYNAQTNGKDRRSYYRTGGSVSDDEAESGIGRSYAGELSSHRHPPGESGLSAVDYRPGSSRRRVSLPHDHKRENGYEDMMNGIEDHGDVGEGRGRSAYTGMGRSQRRVNQLSSRGSQRNRSQSPPRDSHMQGRLDDGDGPTEYRDGPHYDGYGVGLGSGSRDPRDYSSVEKSLSGALKQVTAALKVKEKEAGDLTRKLRDSDREKAEIIRQTERDMKELQSRFSADAARARGRDADYARQLGELKDTNRHLLVSTEKLKNYNGELEGSVCELEGSNKDLTNTVSQLRLSSRKLNDTVGQLRAANQDLTESSQNLKVTVEQLRASNKHAADSNRKLTAITDELKDSNERLKQSWEEVSVRSEAQSGLLREREEESGRLKETLTEQARGRRREVGAKEREVGTKEREVEALKAKLTEAASAHEERGNRFTELLDSMKERLEIKEAEAARLRDELSCVLEEIGLKGQVLKEREAELGDTRRKLAAAHEALDGTMDRTVADEEIKTLNNDMNRKRHRIDALSRQVAEGEDLNATLKYELSVMERRAAGNAHYPGPAPGDSGEGGTGDMASFFDEFRRLRILLERSIESNNVLRQKLSLYLDSSSLSSPAAAAGGHQSHSSNDHSSERALMSPIDPAPTTSDARATRKDKSSSQDRSRSSPGRTYSSGLGRGRSLPRVSPSADSPLRGSLEEPLSFHPGTRPGARPGNGYSGAVSGSDEDTLGLLRTTSSHHPILTEPPAKGRGTTDGLRLNIDDLGSYLPGSGHTAYTVGEGEAMLQSAIAPLSPSEEREVYSVMRLVDFEALRRVTDCSLQILSALEARIRHQMDSHEGHSHCDDYLSTLKHLATSVVDLRSCLFEQKRLITSFDIKELPLPERRSMDRVGSLDSSRELRDYKRKYNHLKGMVASLTGTVNESNTKRADFITREYDQVREVYDVLKRARENLEEKQRNKEL